MNSKVGEITCSDHNYVLWEIIWSEVKSTRKHSAYSIQSPNFTFDVGTFCFAIQLKLPSVNWEVTYVLKLLKLTSTSASSLVKLSISGMGENFSSEWLSDTEPQMEFKTRNFANTGSFPLKICCFIREKTAEDFKRQLRFGNLTTGRSTADETKIEDGAPGPKSVKVSPNERSVAVAEENIEETHEASRSKSTAKLIGDLKEILLSGKDSDVVLKVEGKEFKAHRLIMGMRSPVFSAMFEHEMKEKNSGVVVIEDCDCETFPDLLHYIYTGTVEKLSSDNAPQLYVAADKYQLLELKEECLKYMKQNVSVDNFCDIMTISLRHHETDLTRIATQFFMENASAIAVTVKWMTFLSKNVVVGNELFVKLAGFKGKH